MAAGEPPEAAQRACGVPSWGERAWRLAHEPESAHQRAPSHGRQTERSALTGTSARQIFCSCKAMLPKGAGLKDNLGYNVLDMQCLILFWALGKGL